MIRKSTSSTFSQEKRKSIIFWRLLWTEFESKNHTQIVSESKYLQKKNPIQIAQNEEQYCGEGGWESQSKKLPIQNSKFKANKEGEVFIEIEF